MKAPITVATVIACIAFGAAPAFAQAGGGFQWNASAPTFANTVAAAPRGEPAALHAGAIYLAQSGATDMASARIETPGSVIAMAASCLYLVQNGTWDPPNN